MSTPPEHNPDRAEALRETLAAIFGVGEPSREHLETVLAKVAPEDVASVLSDFDAEEKIRIYQALPTNEARGVVLEETDQQSDREISESLSDEEKIEVLEELSVDDLVDQIEDLPESEQRKVISHLESEDAEDVQELLAFGPDTAGRMMTTDYLSVHREQTSREALEIIQGKLDAEVIAYVYVLGRNEELRGVVSIRNILANQPETPVESYMTRNPISVGVDSDREEAVALVDKYNLPVLPVVDDQGHMRGIVTFDDIIDVAREESSEDIHRLAGTLAVHPFYEPVWAGVWKRLPFLAITALGGLGFAMIKGGFDSIDTQIMSEAMAYVPLVIALSGGVAIVSSTIMVRGLATGEINLSRFGRALTKEVLVGLCLAAILAVAVYLAIWLIESSSGATPIVHGLPVIASIALIGSVVIAAFMGVTIPWLCRLTGRIDPAIASGPFVTMLCDVVAGFLYLLLVRFMTS